mgnify:CR=1 FL=1
MNTNFKCPCCGEKTLTAERMFDICKICGWEDDNIQFSNPDYFGGANYFSLNKYREVFLRERNIERVKEIQETERDKAEAVLKAEYAERIRIILQKRIDFGSAEYWTQESKKNLLILYLLILMNFDASVMKQLLVKKIYCLMNLQSILRTVKQNRKENVMMDCLMRIRM